ncbi:NAD(P)-dependent oxidoreductase [Novosphingobium aquimarinum]|uniref:NAD(P)-dependent oxidoreductase n=1 Tax=Novosphingobium aquimarinum TaxID=2682494 RepID=UPI0018DD0160|nr:NAD(P)-dependent oxidoreductase [Novosphingobium aquimarinum]
MNVAFLGLGQMGSGMANQLIGAGHQVTVWNRDRAKAQPFAEQSAKIAQSPEDAARTGIAMTMLANDDAVEAVVFGEDGILSAGAGVLHISCSTVSVELTKRLAQAHDRAGQRFVSAQVLGRPDVSAAGKLSVLAAGAPSDLDTAQPLFDAIGSGTFRIGEDPVMAVAVKLATNFGISAIIEMLSEQFRIAGVHGVEPAQMADLLIGFDFGNRIIRSYAPMIAEQQFEPAGFPMRLGRKDVGLALAAGEGERLPLAELIAARLDAIIAADGGERDLSALGQPLPE